MRPGRNLDMIDSYWKMAKIARICVPKNTVSHFFLSLWPIPSSWSIFRCEVYSYSTEEYWKMFCDTIEYRYGTDGRVCI